MTIYVDVIRQDAPRPPSAQKLIPGNVMTAPWRPNEARVLYLGTRTGGLKRFAVAKLCDLSRRNCDLRASTLLTPDAKER